MWSTSHLFSMRKPVFHCRSSVRAIHSGRLVTDAKLVCIRIGLISWYISLIVELIWAVDKLEEFVLCYGGISLFGDILDQVKNLKEKINFHVGRWIFHLSV